MCVFFKPSTYDSKTLELRRKKERRRRYLVFWVGVGPKVAWRHCRRRSLSSLRCFLESRWLLLAFSFLTCFMALYTFGFSFTHPLFINLPITILCGFWIQICHRVYMYIYLLSLSSCIISYKLILLCILLW